MKKRTIAIYCMGLLLLTGCKEFSFPGYGKKGDLLAKVGKTELYAEDIQTIYTSDMTAEDSVAMTRTYVDSWIKTQLKIQQAEQLFREDQEDINRQIAEYRNSLLLYKYEQQYLGTHVDTIITPQQITEYYDSNKDRLLLAGPVVKARVVRIPAGYRQAKKLQEMFLSNKEGDFVDFLDTVEKNNFKFDDFTTAWYDLNEVLRTLPFSYRENNIIETLKSKRFYEATDRDYTYLMVITAFRDTGETAPMERVESIIRQMIFNKRRQDLIRKMEDSLYQAELQAQNIIVRK